MAWVFHPHTLSILLQEAVYSGWDITEWIVPGCRDSWPYPPPLGKWIGWSVSCPVVWIQLFCLIWNERIVRFICTCMIWICLLGIDHELVCKTQGRKQWIKSDQLPKDGCIRPSVFSPWVLMIALARANATRYSHGLKFCNFNSWFLPTSRISGQGHRIGAICVCVCVSVCLWTLSRRNRLTYDLDLCPSCQKDYRAKGLCLRGTREVSQRSGVFILWLILWNYCSKPAHRGTRNPRHTRRDINIIHLYNPLFNDNTTYGPREADHTCAKHWNRNMNYINTIGTPIIIQPHNYDHILDYRDPLNDILFNLDDTPTRLNYENELIFHKLAEVLYCALPTIVLPRMDSKKVMELMTGNNRL